MITALIAPLTCLHFNADKTLASPEDLQTENVGARGGKRSLLTHHHYNHHQSIWLRRWHCHLAGFRRPLYAATLSSLLGICHSFHLLGKEEGGGGDYDPIIFLKSTRLRLTLFHPTLSQCHSSIFVLQPSESQWSRWRTERDEQQGD